MKIVTAGQRGIVATEDEIREVHNNKCRLFSYSLALLFSLCSGGEAAAAKLCQAKLSTKGKSWAVLDHFFITGENCGNEVKPIGTYFGNICTSKYTVGIWSCNVNVSQPTKYECNCRIVFPYTTLYMQWCTGLFNTQAECEAPTRCQVCCANAFNVIEDNSRFLTPDMSPRF